MQRSSIGSLRDRIIFRTQVIVFDTGELLGAVARDAEGRCRYVERLLLEIDYPVATLPWSDPINMYTMPKLNDHDITWFYETLRLNLIELSWMGEELLVSPSAGNRVIIHYYKGQT